MFGFYANYITDDEIDHNAVHIDDCNNNLTDGDTVTHCLQINFGLNVTQAPCHAIENVTIDIILL